MSYVAITGICADYFPVPLSVKPTLRYSVMPEVGRVWGPQIPHSPDSWLPDRLCKWTTWQGDWELGGKERRHYFSSCCQHCSNTEDRCSFSLLTLSAAPVPTIEQALRALASHAHVSHIEAPQRFKLHRPSSWLGGWVVNLPFYLPYRGSHLLQLPYLGNFSLHFLHFSHLLLQSQFLY